MRYLSVCSGIEAATVAWHPLGWTPLAFAEIAKFPRKVLAHHYPDVPLYGDFTLLRDQPWIGQADVLIGGTPCQSFSVAGLRGGLSDARGNLTLEFVRLANAVDDLRPHDDPATIVWENVPGVLSSRDNAFGALLAGLGGCDAPIVNTGGWPGAGVVAGPRRIVAWRVLDAQFFGVAQRRRRVFVLAVGRAAPCGGWSAADALLPIESSLQRDLAESRATRKGTPRNAATGANPNDRAVGTMTFAGGNSAVSMTGQDASQGLYAISATLKAGKHGTQDPDRETYVFGAQNSSTQGDSVSQTTCPTLDKSKIPAVLSVALRGRDGGATAELGGDMAGTLRASGGGGDKAHAMVHGLVRRLTPTEAEFLQGFPRNYTAIPGAADGPRYQALGNSMAVPVISWIGRRINATRNP